MTPPGSHFSLGRNNFPGVKLRGIHFGLAHRTGTDQLQFPVGFYSVMHYGTYKIGNITSVMHYGADKYCSFFSVMHYRTNDMRKGGKPMSHYSSIFELVDVISFKSIPISGLYKCINYF